MASQSHLILLQQSPFCNIDCRYCYLPDRAVSLKMSPQVLELAFKKTLSSPVLTGSLRYLWHAGEPLAAGKEFFCNAFSIFDRLNRVYQRDCTHSIQSNVTLMDDEWIDLFVRHNVSVGISLDGPQFIHDQNRITRKGYGTHAQIMKSVALLQSRAVNFGVIMVLTHYALDHADEIFWFFVNHKIRNVAFNVDEVEGHNSTSSFEASGAMEKYRRFLQRFLQLLWDDGASTLGQSGETVGGNGYGQSRGIRGEMRLQQSLGGHGDGPGCAVGERDRIVRGHRIKSGACRVILVWAGNNCALLGIGAAPAQEEISDVPEGQSQPVQRS